MHFRGVTSAACAAADKMDDLKAVAVGDLGGGPGSAGNDGAVVLDGDAILLQTEGSEQVVHGRFGRKVRELALLSVDDTVHVLRVTAGYRSAQVAEQLPTGIADEAHEALEEDGKGEAAEYAERFVGEGVVRVGNNEGFASGKG
jgi:hypothetical protein